MSRAGTRAQGILAVAVFFAIAPRAAAQEVELRAELVVDFTTVDVNDRQPIEVTHVRGDASRIYIALQNGRIRMVTMPGDIVDPKVFLDIRTKVSFGGERGLLGLAFHPSYSENGFLYVFYTRASDGDLVISRFSRSVADPDVADPDSEKIILGPIEHSSAGNHNGGKIAFSPIDGYLYIGTGDGGGGCDDQGQNSQKGTSLLGKLLRIDVDGGDPYAVPPTNPFLEEGDGIRDEIWALGLRNPWRWAFDSLTGDLYIGDVGQNSKEEISFQPASSAGGENYQWNPIEGDEASGCGSISPYGPGTRTAPILTYGRGTGRCITGGHVYRGPAMPALQGTYFYAEYEVPSFVKSFRYSEGSITEQRDRTAQLNLGIAPDELDGLASFGEDASGEIYICDHPTKVFRIVSASGEPGDQDFIRGNGNGDGVVDISDSVYVLVHLFIGSGGEPPCEDALDTDDNGIIEITDAVYGLNALFTGGPPPPQPYPQCAGDPTADDLGCLTRGCE
jgi:glucose/arabinose dehydrogenase